MDQIEEHTDLALFAVSFGRLGRLICPRRWTAMDNFKILACLQGAIYKKAVFSEHGLYDPSYDVCMDYDHLLRIYRAGARISKFRQVISKVGDEGISSDM